jgi:hypothetical protein
VSAPDAPAAAAGPQLTMDTASQAESLDQLEAVGDAFTGQAGAPGAPPGGQVAAQQTNAVLIADTLKTARDTFCNLAKLHAPAATLTDAACKQMGELWGAWCDRRQIQLGKYMGNHHDTYLAALATVGLALTVYQATSAEIALRRPVDVKAKPDQAAAAAPPPPAHPEAAGTFVGGPLQ